jgi:hypothetical protein
MRCKAKKMIGVRITNVTGGKMFSYNIAVRGYNPLQMR